MNPDAMITTLESLKLHGMADAIETLNDKSADTKVQQENQNCAIISRPQGGVSFK